MLLWEIPENAAGAVASRTALVTPEGRWSFADLADATASVSRRLAGIVNPGDRVAVVSENSDGYVAALYGVPRAGAVLVHGNTRHTPSELQRLFVASGATVLLGSRPQLERLEEVHTPLLGHRIPLDDLVPSGGTTPQHHFGTGRNEALDEAGGRDPGERHDTDLAWLMYTSGTTGAPKGVMLTHRSLISAALNTNLARPVADDEVYLFPFPLFHVAAYNVIHHHLRHRPVVLTAGFEPVAVMEAIRSEGVTSISLAPTMLSMLLEHPERRRFELSSLRNISYGAAAMPHELLHRSLEELPRVGLSQGYGMTELSGNAVFLSPEDHRRSIRDDPQLLTAAGRPAPMTSLRIVDPEGADLPTGEAGEILVRGDQVCAGYFRDEAASTELIVDGWLRTGDLGRIDERGYLHVLDRLKDIIITGGENVSSREVEDALGLHPGVRAVAVVGIPDDRWGEVVTAAVVPAEPDDPPTVEVLREACSNLAGFKHPRRVFYLDALLTNASGKVDKVALRGRIGAPEEDPTDAGPEPPGSS